MNCAVDQTSELDESAGVGDRGEDGVVDGRVAGEQVVDEDGVASHGVVGADNGNGMAVGVLGHLG